MSYLYRLVAVDINISKKILSDKHTERTKSDSKEINGRTPVDFSGVKISTILCFPSLCFRKIKRTCP